MLTLGGAWLSGLLFVGVQAYLAFFENSIFWLAQLSYVCEVVGLLGHFALPAISGFDYLLNMEAGGPMDEAKRHIANHLAKPKEQ